MPEASLQSGCGNSLLRKALGILLRSTIVVGCLVYAFWGIDLSQFSAAFARYSLPVLGMAFCYSLMQYVPLGFRLNFLTNHEAGVYNSIKAGIFCLGVNNIFPAKLGEVAKAFYLRRKACIPLGRGLGIVFWERFFDLNCLLIMAICTAYGLGYSLAVVPLGAIVGTIWSGLFLLRLFPGLADVLARCIPMAKVRTVFLDAVGNLRAFTGIRFFTVLALYTAVVWSVYASIIIILIRYVAGIDLTLVQALTVFIMGALGYAVPSSPGALGVFEAATVLALGWFGVGKEEALSIGLTIRAVQTLPPIAAALLIMAKSGLSMRSIRESQEDGEDAATLQDADPGCETKEHPA